MAHRDPYKVLGVDAGASAATIKAAWRRLARAHHPDVAADEGNTDEATRRMVEINAAYDELRTPGRRQGGGAAGTRAGASPPGRSNGSENGTGAAHATYEYPAGPPPDPPTPPVTARLDTTGLFRPRNATITPEGGGLRHHPRPRAEPLRARAADREARRASDPNGPLERSRPHRAPRHERPTLAVARTMEIGFGKFCGWSLGAIAAVEPTYLEWVERTVTREPDLVAAVRIVLAAQVGVLGE